LLPHQSQVDDAGLAAVAAGAALAAAALVLSGERLPRWAFQLVAAAGTVFVSLALLFNGERSGGQAGGDEMYYLWVALYAAYFFGPLATAAQAAAIALVYAATLAAIDPGPIAVSRWLSTVGLVVGSAVVVRLLSARVARLVASLERMARTDHLTGMPNRLAFEELFDRQVTSALRTNRPFALLLADLDRFKELNDRLGHAAGDAALAELGRLFSTELGPDLAARVGGDEFAVLLPETDRDGALEAGDRIARAAFNRLRARGAPVTLSYGVSTFGADGRTLDDLTKAADEALYMAKRHGPLGIGATAAAG
jgi:diguanylate cyclase (GGDEF)-like protein